MTDNITKQWDEISKTVISSVEELSNINTRVIEKLTEQQLAMLNTCMEVGQKELNLATSEKDVRDPQTLLAAQADLVAEYNSKLMAIVQSTGDILKDCNSEITIWADKGMNVVQKSAAKPAKKTTKKKTKKTTKKKTKKTTKKKTKKTTKKKTKRRAK